MRCAHSRILHAFLMCTQRVELGIDGIGKSDVWTLRDFQCSQNTSRSQDEGRWL